MPKIAIFKTTSLICVLGLGLAGACKKDETASDPGTAKVDAPAKTVDAAKPTKTALDNAPTEAAAAKDVEAGELSVSELASLLAGKTVAIFDANGKDTRDKYGVIPSAKLLTHYADYQLTELPNDKSSKLVYYCSNTQCGASHAAAKKAILAGYSDVHVLPDGIMGWVEAGKKVDKL